MSAYFVRLASQTVCPTVAVFCSTRKRRAMISAIVSRHAKSTAGSDQLERIPLLMISIGSKVLVPRSNGSHTLATVRRIDPAIGIYPVQAYCTWEEKHPITTSSHTSPSPVSSSCVRFTDVVCAKYVDLDSLIPA